MADALVAQHADTVLRVALGLPPEGSQSLNDAIGGSWRRCVRDYSLDPVRAHAPAVVSGTALKDRQVQHDHLIQNASAEMDSLYDQIAGSGYALLLTDATGIILCERVDPTLKRMFGSAGLVIGADWSELHEGTNGIGTCIREDRPVTVHRAEHFHAQHIGLSCSGAPIHDPAGALLAVLDASTVDARDTRASQAHTMALVNVSARLIEKCVFLQHHQSAVVVRFHSRPELVSLLHDGSLALGDDGTVTAADDTAVRLLGARSRRELIGRALDDIFDTSIRDLLAPAALARRALWPVRDLALGRRFFASVHPASGMRPAARSRVGVSLPARSPPIRSRLTLDDIAGEDPQLIETVRRAARVASSGLPILIQGPTGSGKECLARALHAASERASASFVAVNCAALPETLIESELFGYAPGAFTGARKEGKQGKIVQSSGGTLFLDEIGDMPLALQTRLLRVLEEQEVTPLGAEQAVTVNLRVMCATHRHLRDMVARGVFREDLYYRLNGMTFELPPLAARADKHTLIRRLLDSEADAKSGFISADALERLLVYQWPGNMRELTNVIRGALAVSEGGVIHMSDLPREIAGRDAERGSSEAAASAVHVACADERASEEAGTSSLRAERDTVLEAIRASGGNLVRAARLLGISRNTLYRKLRRHDIVVSRVEGLSIRPR